MRRDVYIQNDSGGFSVVSGTAVDAIIADRRANDEQFVDARHALLLLLVGDDSLPVRFVVDEPLRDDETREWLARIKWQLDVPDGRILAMGGFDPDILRWWRDDHGPDEDGTGIAVAHVAPGRWDVDLYTFAGSLNGNVLLEQGPLPAGAWFRRDHPNTPFPLWLAHVLDFSGTEDPGHEEEWRTSKASFEDGKLAIATDVRGFIGLLIHVHKRPAGESLADAPEGAWFDPDAGARALDQCPLGIAAAVEDPNLVSLAQRLTGMEPPARAERFLKGEGVDIGSTWDAEPAPLGDGIVRLPLARAWQAWAVAGLAGEGMPALQVRVANAREWRFSDNDWLHIDRSGDQVVIGSPENLAGWGAWPALPALSAALSGVPNAAVLDLMTGFAEPDEDQPEDGRLRLTGPIVGGEWIIDSASHGLNAAALRAALEFVDDLFTHHRINTRTVEEVAALEHAYNEWSDFLGEDCIERNESGALFNQTDQRTLVMIGRPVFRRRFAEYWPLAEDEF